jgi:hypothetical protein
MPLPFSRRALQTAPSFSRDFAGLKTLDHGVGPAITFTRASNATFFDANGTLQTAANDTPRFDHSGGSSLGLLIEEARTNLLLNSATLATQTITVTAVAHTLSFYGTGEVVLSGAHSVTVTGTGAFPTRTSLTFTPSAGSLTATVSGTVEYAQLEVGAFATSYITTTGATATRSADSAVVTPISSFYNQAEGTIVSETTAIGYGSSFPTVWFLNNDAGASQYIAFYHRANNYLEVSGSGFGQATGGVTIGTTYRLGFATSAGSTRLALNGALVGSDSAAASPTVTPTRIHMGRRSDGSQHFTGHIRKIAYYPRRLSNTLLQQLTT